MHKEYEYEYKVASEVSAPIYYDVETGKVLEQSSEDSTQGFWVVCYNKTEGYIEEWLERFDSVDEAQRFLDNMENK